MREVVGEAVDLVVSIERTAAGRRVRNVMQVNGFDGKAYETALAELSRELVRMMVQALQTDRPDTPPGQLFLPFDLDVPESL